MSRRAQISKRLAFASFCGSQSSNFASTAFREFLISSKTLENQRYIHRKVTRLAMVSSASERNVAGMPSRKSKKFIGYVTYL